MDAPPLDLEELSRNARWLTRLARRLVDDEHLADDVVQDTWLTALRRPPRGSGPEGQAARGWAARGWLAKVVRSKARALRDSERRRAQREQTAASAPAAEDPAGVVAEVQTQRRLIDAVMRLREPYRSTLLLRYWGPHEVGTIAQRMDAPEATVRTRLRRGLEELRARLDRDWPGGHPAWVLALAPLAQTPGEAMPPESEHSGRAAASEAASRTRLLLGGVAAAGAALLLWGWSGGSEEAPSSPEPSELSSSSTHAAVVPPSRSARPARQPIDDPPPSGVELPSPDDSPLAGDPAERQRVHPRDLDELRSLLAEVEGLEIEARHRLAMPWGAISFPESPRVRFTEEEARRLAEAVLASYAPREDAMGLDWPHEMRLLLSGDRVWCLCVARDRLFGGGLPDSELSTALEQQASDLVRRAEEAAIVASGIALGREGFELLPRDTREIIGYSLEDEDLAALSRFAELELLDLGPCRKSIRDPGLAALTGCPRLRHLRLRFAEFAGRKLAELRGLEELSLPYAAGLAPEAFEQIALLPRLHTLQLSRAKGVDRSALEALAASPSLRRLEIDGCRLEADALEPLQALRSLEELDVSNTSRLDARSLGALARLPRLRRLDLGFVELDAEGLAALSASRSLVELDLQGRRELPGEALGALEPIESLRVLSLSSFQDLGDEGARALRNCRGLRELDLHFCRLGDEGVRALCELAELRRLDLGFSRMGDAALADLLEGLPQLEELRLTACKRLGDEATRALARCSRLRRLDLSLCEGLGAAAVDALVEALPDCEIERPDS